ncbi:hypothetical protein Tco_1147619 [Tanacetum coccineum]
MTYGAVPDALDEYLQMGATIARKCLQMFCKAIMELYGEDFLGKPTYTDMENLYAYHEEKHEFPGMLESIDCTDFGGDSSINFREEQKRDDDPVRTHQVRIGSYSGDNRQNNSSKPKSRFSETHLGS